MKSITTNKLLMIIMPSVEKNQSLQEEFNKLLLQKHMIAGELEDLVIHLSSHHLIFSKGFCSRCRLLEAESSSRGGGGGGGGGGVSPEPQYQQSLYNSSWRGGDSSSSPRERKEVIAAGLMSESLMNLEAAAGVGAGAAGGRRVMMTMMMMAQQHQQQQQEQPPQQQTRSTFWQALARTTSSNQINLFLSLDQAVVCTDVGGNITSWNQAAESLYQWKSEEVLQSNIVDVLIPQNLRKAGWEVVARVGYGESWSGALYCKRKDGVLLDTVFSETPIVDDDHNIVGGIAIDVTAAAAAAAVVAKSSTSNLKQQQSSSSSSLSVGKEEGAAVENSSSLGTMTSLKPVAGSSESPTVVQTKRDQTPNGSSHNGLMQKNEHLQHPRSDAKSVVGSGVSLPPASPPVGLTGHGSGVYKPGGGRELRAEVSATPNQAEEDYQLQLAIALRVAAEAAAVDDPHLSANVRGPHGNTRKMPGVSTVEATAYRFWVSNCLGYDDRIEDGFYEVWGMSPYVWSMCTDNNELGRIPPLAALQSVSTSESFEVVLVDRNDDQDLRELEDKAVGLAYGCQEVLDLATRLAQMVASIMGGPAASDADLLEAWHANTTKMTQRLGSIVLPIGVLRPGLGRHRALLFKVMADSVGLPCRLVRGRSFCGKEEGALVVVKVGDDREWMVDLLESPGKIMAPDARLASPPAVIASPLQFERPSSFAISSILNWRDELGLRDPANSGGEVAPGPASELAASSRSAVPVAAATEAGKVGYGHSPRGATQQQQANDASPRGGGAGSGIPTGNRYNEDYHPRPSGFNKENVKGRASGDVSVAGRSDNSGGTNDRGVSSSPEEDSSRYSREKLVEHAVAFAKEYEIPWEDLLIGERIGQGSYGKVYRADWQGSDVAVKVFLDQHVQMEAIEEFKAEVAIMRRLRHPNVVLFMGAVTKPPNLSIITEFCPRGSLYRLLHRPNRELDEKRRIRMALDVVKGMNYLHRCSPPVVHRDLKSPNLLVDKNWTVKVCDFGLSRLKHNAFLSSKSSAGTPEWMAPEVLRNELSDEKSDIYSFGVILWELSTLQQPWTGMNPIQVVGAVGFQHRRLPIPDNVDPAIANIIQACWRMDPRQRPSFSEIMQELKILTRPATSPQTQNSAAQRRSPPHDMGND
ncbi:unnamed protein product [Sphagnum jensenii]|uniref:Uncharacterized protein n=1 Tax=Sphagnum jensenii TaxID=128206 RepID=A0ABP1BKM7_9BRYO